MASRTADDASARRHRYARAATTSMTQMLSDSCSSLLHRLTRRVPSEKPDRSANLSIFSPKSRYDELKVLDRQKDSVLNSVRRYETDRSYEKRPEMYSAYTDSKRRIEDKTPVLSYGKGTATIRRNVTPVRASAHSKSRPEESRPLLSTFRQDNRNRPIDPVSPAPSVSRTPAADVLLAANSLGSTRSRLEDKYSAVLDKVASRKKERQLLRENEDHDRTVEPSLSRSIVRSITSAVFGDKSHPYVTPKQREKTRDKTPYRGGERRPSSVSKSRTEAKTRREGITEERPNASSYRGKDRDSAYRISSRSTLGDSARSSRAGKSSTADRLKHMRLCAVDIGEGPPLSQSASCAAIASSRRQQRVFDEDDDLTPTIDPAVLERETRRKEIQSLIMKYAALDEVYGRGDPHPPAQQPPPANANANVANHLANPPPARTHTGRPKHVDAVTPPVSPG